ncbi:hypothetical protein N5P37_010388 [Trichoderma harzianum]|uniref:Uncharacterized protein n=1 Tax=Trichoderma harzianum CBS 226.95 TaxID=983964 RepID=A0A2T4A030_TRIHA|nr:hypothetical protein M431DRAFT_9127 [Trichoderma harzianum CBS 226.95]KAK0756868.1 hypothetical protein N5P37_010388 [Trichoderma harzianum]PKK41231.1 hypothetical protein CI102_14668 [Trichoderma harzianum]PTB50421.1 hypothetical protein M431DRAFT_9127 [Trichoderma harzianum CBS 226.95]
MKDDIKYQLSQEELDILALPHYAFIYHEMRVSCEEFREFIQDFRKDMQTFPERVRSKLEILRDEIKEFRRAIGPYRMDLYDVGQQVIGDLQPYRVAILKECKTIFGEIQMLRKDYPEECQEILCWHIQELHDDVKGLHKDVQAFRNPDPKRENLE